jgi:hypothetical protein
MEFFTKIHCKIGQKSIKTYSVHSTSFVGNECETFSFKFEPDVGIEMLSDTSSSKDIKIKNKIHKIGTTKQVKKQNKGISEFETLAQLRKSNSLISKSFENSDEPNEYQHESKFTQMNNEEKTTG